MTFKPDYYSISIRKEIHDDEEFYVGRVAEFPNIGVFEASPEDAYALVVDAINTLNDIAVEGGQELPSPFPSPQDEFSGRVTLRLPRSLHAKVSAYANAENCSVNTFLISAISEFVGEKNLKQKVEARNDVSWVVLNSDNQMKWVARDTPATISDKYFFISDETTIATTTSNVIPFQNYARGN